MVWCGRFQPGWNSQLASFWRFTSCQLGEKYANRSHGWDIPAPFHLGNLENYSKWGESSTFDGKKITCKHNLVISPIHGKKKHISLFLLLLWMQNDFVFFWQLGQFSVRLVLGYGPSLTARHPNGIIYVGGWIEPTPSETICAVVKSDHFPTNRGCENEKHIFETSTYRSSSWICLTAMMLEKSSKHILPNGAAKWWYP